MGVRRISFLVVLVAFVSAATPVHAARDNPYWDVETNVPVETIEGQWDVADKGKSATLEFSGVNVIAQETTFTAGWVSPWVDRETAEEGGVSVLMDPIHTGRITLMRRVQIKGSHWSQWFTNRLKIEDMGGEWRWAGGGAVFGPHSKVRYEWRIVGEIIGVTQIEGQATISVD